MAAGSMKNKGDSFMNIVIINCFDTWEHRADLLYKVLTEEGHSVRVLQSDYLHIDKKRRVRQKRGYQFFRAKPYTKNLSAARIQSHIQMSRDIFQYIEKRAEKIDLLWVFAPPNLFVRDAARICQRHRNVKLIVDLMDMWPETLPVNRLKKLPVFWMWKQLRDKYLCYADAVVTECSLYHNVIKKAAGSVKIYTLYLAREKKEYQPCINLPDGKISLCCLGSVNHIIDIRLIGTIIRQYRKSKPVILHIIGDGEKKDELIRVSASAGADVVYHGRIYDRKKKQRIFDSCHYGINIMKESVCVGFSMRSTDYFEYGLPVINNIKGDTWAAVEKYGLGKNYHGSVPDCAGSIKNRKNARKFFETFLTEDVFRNKVLEIIREINMQNQTKSVLRKSNYEAAEIIKNAVTIFRNRIRFPSARLIRYPVTVRGGYLSAGEKGLRQDITAVLKSTGSTEKKCSYLGKM